MQLLPTALDTVYRHDTLAREGRHCPISHMLTRRTTRDPSRTADICQQQGPISGDWPEHLVKSSNTGKLPSGGGGGNRTRVRKPSTTTSTCVSGLWREPAPGGAFPCFGPAAHQPRESRHRTYP